MIIWESTPVARLGRALSYSVSLCEASTKRVLKFLPLKSRDMQWASKSKVFTEMLSTVSVVDLRIFSEDGKISMVLEKEKLS